MAKKDYIDQMIDAMPFKDAKVFSDLFTLTDNKGHHSYNGTGPEVSHYCSITDHRPGKDYFNSLQVTANEKVLAFIRTSMLSITGGVFFEIVIREDNTALVIIKYNCIIGSRWIAFIDPESIPALDKVN